MSSAWQPTYGTDQVLHRRHGTHGQLRLNRPQSINALTMPMVEALLAQLNQWADDDTVDSVRLDGSGERGLCSGADVRALRDQAVAGDLSAAHFLTTEYRLNALIASYPKPFRAIMTGVTMGGGLGVSGHGSDRVVDASSRIAMPETQIGLYPDVGMLYYLSRAGVPGLYLALTGAVVGAQAAIAVGLADRRTDASTPDEPQLPSGQWLESCFAADNPVELFTRLEGDWDDPEPGECARLLRSRCPYSVWVTWVAWHRATTMDVAQVLELDSVLAPQLVVRGDFAEGVRAQLVDRDRNPSWNPATVEHVEPDIIAALFTSQR